MKRKVALIGPSTLMISLPSKWVKEQHIAKGDELEVLEQQTHLLIMDKNGEKPLEKKTVDIRSLNTSIAWYYLLAAYRSGAEEITVQFGDEVIEDVLVGKKIKIFDFIKSVVDDMIGMEIIRNTNTYCIVKEISAIKEGELNTIVRRIFFLLTNMFDDLSAALKKKDKKLLEHLYQYSDLQVNRFTDYAMRIITKTNNPKKTLYAVIIDLEEIGDALKYLAHHLQKNMQIKEIDDQLQQLKELFSLVEKFYFTGKQELFRAVDEKKREIRKKMSGLGKNEEANIVAMLNKIFSRSLTIANARLLENV